MSRTVNDDEIDRILSEMNRSQDAGSAEPEQPAKEAEQPAKEPEQNTKEPKQNATASKAESFDYVIPPERKKRKKKKHKNSSKPHETLEESAEGYIFSLDSGKKRHRKHKKKKPLWLRILIIVLCVILGLAIIATSAYFIMKEIGRRAMHNYENIDIVIPLSDDKQNDADVIDKGRTIKYGGKTYLLNEDMLSVTFIGYSKDSNTNKYMGDAIYMLAVDSKTGKTTIVGISRDTMTDVDVYSFDKYINTEKMQICYAYSFGGERLTGGENMNKSLSRLFFGLPLNNYFAIDLDSLKDLNDAIGGVTLTSMMEFESAEYGRTIEEGEEITLYGQDVEKYVRSRDGSLESNNSRMDRQQQYIKAFLSSIVPAAKKDISTVTRLFGVVSDNADTSLDLPKVTYLATTALSKMRSASDIEYIRLRGEIKMGEENAEMYVQDKDVLETLLKVFYKEI